MSKSLQSHGLQLSRLLCLWNSPGNNIGAGSHSLPPEDLPNPEIEPKPPTFRADSLPYESLGKPYLCITHLNTKVTHLFLRIHLLLGIKLGRIRTLGPDHSLLWGWHPSLYPWDASSIPSQLGQPNRSPDAALCPSPPWGHSPRPGPSILHIFQNSLSASFLACAPYFSPRNSLPGSQSKPFMRKCGDNSFHLDPPEASCHAGWNAACLPSLPRPCPGLPVPALTSLPHSHSA